MSFEVMRREPLLEVEVYQSKSAVHQKNRLKAYEIINDHTKDSDHRSGLSWSLVCK